METILTRPSPSLEIGPVGWWAFEEDDDEDVVRAALSILASRPSTADKVYVAVWEGRLGNQPAPEAPRFHISNRETLLFTGPGLLRDQVIHPTIPRDSY